MIPKFNLHTHSSFCDGKNTPEEMVLRAIELGCEGIGFSGHSHMKNETDWTMSESGTLEYISEIERLREKYAERIEILLGTEYDITSEIDTSPYDYVIGSVHSSPRGRLPIDHSAKEVKEMVENCFGGDYYAFTSDYYEALSGIRKKTGCDIVGHFDLVTKFNEGGALFDEGDKRYRDSAFDCLEVLNREGVIFEINTGAISRGYRTEPYPSRELLKRMAELGAKLTITTDSHSIDTLLCAYDTSVEYARACGVRELYFPKNKKFMAYKI